ncbi:hypothetical protein WICMUC_000351 [Wickerhamomyces mucosus]|uniref:Nuclear control of ATPase protein 2 n=1 Tax=Wickerhamomyces mucosus TaxID=1378264 RepID=A0A9P8TJ05_9ASCO|nr:hypothetical protein WICMUC_000351 [Wickerhamomyces mucosus]
MSASRIINDSFQTNVKSLNELSNSLITDLTQLRIIQSTKINNVGQEYPQQSELIIISLNKVRAIFDKTIKSEYLINIKEIVDILKPFAKGSIISNLNSETPESKLLKKLETQLLLYLILSIYQIYSINLLKVAIPLNEDHYYYESIINSNWRVLLYSIQQFPKNFSLMVGRIYKDFRENLKIISNKEWEFKFYKDSLFNSFYKNLLNSPNFQNFNRSLTLNSVGLLTTKTFYEKPISYSYYILQTPFVSLYNNVVTKKKSINKIQNENAKTLGQLISHIPDFDSKLSAQTSIEFFENLLNVKKVSETTDDFERLYKIVNSAVPASLSSLKYQVKSLEKPSFFTRYWPSLLLSLLYGPSAILSLYSQRDEIYQFFQKNLVETTIGFYENWIITPINNILSTIRHDSYSEISITSQNSLESDLNSLKRMVIDYIDENPQLVKDSVLTNSQIEELVNHGDLSPIMKDYEVDIKQPLKSIVTGKLPRNLLIQVQKTKVDGGLAISGIDKMLKSQELVFGFIAASPSLIILFYTLSAIKSFINNESVWKSTRETKLIVSKSLNNIERLLISAETEDINLINGRLLIETISLKNYGSKLLPKNRLVEWNRDLNDLLLNKSIDVKFHHVNRIYNVYSRKYF